MATGDQDYSGETDRQAQLERSHAALDAEGHIVVDQLPLDTFYMTQKNREVIRDTLDSLAISLANHKHQWSNYERKMYNKAIKLLS